MDSIKSIHSDSSKVLLFLFLFSRLGLSFVKFKSHSHFSYFDWTLQSPLLSAFRVAFNFRFTMFWDKFPNIDYAKFIRCPVFIVHGTMDEVVPFWHGEELFLAFEQCWRAKPFWVEGAGHNNIEALLRPSGAFVDKLIEFLDLHISARRGELVGPIPVPECVPLAIQQWEVRSVQRAS